MHFRRPTWSPAQKQQVRETASHALRQFILDAQLLGRNACGSIDWNLDGADKDGHTQLYTGKTPFNVVVLATARRVRGTLAQAATICQQFPTTHHFDALVSVAVASLDDEASHQHVGVTWMSLKVASTGTAQHRDACVLEVRDMFDASDSGVKGFASLVQSIDLPECPRIGGSHGLVRMHIQHTGYTFTEVSPGLLDVVCTIHVDFRGTLPSWVARRYMRKRVAGMSAHLSMSFKQMQAAASATSTLHNVVSAKQCASCFRPFKTFESKRTCTTCRDRVCKACHTTTFVAQFNQVLPVCVRCVLKDATPNRQGRQLPGPRRSSQDSSSSSASSQARSTTSRRSSAPSSSVSSSGPTPLYRPHNPVSGWALQNHKIVLLDGDDADAPEPTDSRSLIPDDEDSDGPLDKTDVDAFLDMHHQFFRLDGRLYQVNSTPGNERHDHDEVGSLRPTASSTLEESRLSVMSDDGGVNSLSSVVWKDAISNFHSNLRQFKHSMHTPTQPPRRPRQHAALGSS